MSVSCRHKKPSGTVWIWPVNFSRLLPSFSEWMKRIQQDSRYVEKVNLNKAKLYRQSYFWVFGAEENGLGAGRLLDCSQSPIFLYDGRDRALCLGAGWASGFIGSSGREVTLRAESSSIFLENIGKMKASPSSVICHTVITSLQLAFQEAWRSSNASIRLVIRQ